MINACSFIKCIIHVVCNNSFQRSVEETVSSLRGLFNKSSLLSDDLTCAIATNENSCCNNVMTDLIGQLLMLFLMFSSGGHLIYKTILSVVTIYPFFSTNDYAW